MVFVARDGELAELRAAFDHARGGAPAAVLVTGDAGVGKSRLVAEFVATLAGTARVLTGGCLDLDGDGLPFAPFTSALRELGPDGVRELLPDPGELARLLPTLGPPPAGDTELARARLFEQVLALLRALAPAVLVVEDVHWADRSTRDLLTFLVGNQRAAPGLLVVATGRGDLDRAARSLLADLGRVGWVRRLDLRPLSKRDVTAQLRGLLGREPDAGIAETVFTRSEGNPLFVEALVDCLEVPQSIRDLLLAPLARLPAASQDVVRAAAPCGVHIGHELLATVTGLDETTLSAALRPAVAANLLRVAGDGYLFRHALIREVIHDDLLPGERARLHVRYAEALEQDPALAPPGRATAQLARHWGAVAGRHPLRALTAAWHAAADAGRSLAHAEQLGMLTEALRLWDQVPDAADRVGATRHEVLTAATDAAAAAGDVAHALTLLETLLSEVDEPVEVGELLMRRGQLRHALGRPGAIDDLRAAAALVSETRPAVLGALAHRLLTVPRDDQGRAVAEQAIAAARRVGDTRTEVMAAAGLAHADARTGDLDTQLPVLAGARTRAEQHGDDVAVLHVLRLEADALQGAGRYEAAAATARHGLAVAAAAGLARTSGPIQAANLAESLIALGDWDEAVRVIEDALGHPPVPSQDAYLLVLHGTIRLARGDLAGARMAVTYAREVFARGYPDTQDLLPLTGLEVDLALAEGRPVDAAALVADAVALPHVEASPRYLWPVVVSAARIPGPHGRLWELAGRLPVFGPVQHAHRLTFAAIVEPATGAWDGVAAAWAALGEPYPWARALLAAATEAGDDAAGRLRVAARHAERLGAGPLRTEIDRLAKVLRVPPTETDDRHGLTDRELEVLELLAEGHTNRQIAAELYISAKTVSTHVSNILTKLAVPGRVQAANAAHRLNLVPIKG